MSTSVRWILIVAAAVLGLLTGVVLTGLANAVAIPIQRQASVRMPGWPADAPTLRVALLADIHVGNRRMQPQRLNSIIDQVNAAHPDLVLLAGDFVSGHDPARGREQAAELAPLARLRAPLGVIAVLGNHDHWTDAAVVRAALQAAGIVVLENQVVRRGPLAVVGIDDRYSGHDDIRQATAQAQQLGGTAIVLTHSPDIAPDLPAGFTLVLAGHTHCGQIVLPALGAPVSLVPQWQHIYNPHYRCGLIRDPDRLVVVTAGLGAGTVPLRLGAMPDWWLLSLQP